MWRKLSFIAFLSSLGLMILLYFHLDPFGAGVPRLMYILGIFLLGFLGFIFSVVSILLNASKKELNRREQILLFHLGMILVFFGIVSRLLVWSYTNYFFLSGLLLISLSFFIKSRKPSQDDDILDG